MAKIKEVIEEEPVYEVPAIKRGAPDMPKKNMMLNFNVDQANQ